MKIRCNNCDWEGQEDDLALIEYNNNDPTAVGYAKGEIHIRADRPKDVNFFKGCPNCETDAYLMDL